MNRQPKNDLVWRQRITASDATGLWESLRDLRDVSEETSLINLPGDVSEISKSALLEMSLRRCLIRLWDASEIHPGCLGWSSKTSSGFDIVETYRLIFICLMFLGLLNKLLNSLANFLWMASSQFTFLLEIFVNNTRVCNTKGDMTPNRS